MSSAASTAIALASLGLAALTVLVSYLNVRRQAEAAQELERAKWLRDKRDDLYGRIVGLFAHRAWQGLQGPDDVRSKIERWKDERWDELDEVSRLAIQYASDAVLSQTEALADAVTRLWLMDGDTPYVESSRAHHDEHTAWNGLIREIREEFAGHEEAEKTWRRYEALRRPGGSAADRVR
jgi:hypothetical protein